jgi:hypothetical protein
MARGGERGRVPGRRSSVAPARPVGFAVPPLGGPANPRRAFGGSLVAPPKSRPPASLPAATSSRREYPPLRVRPRPSGSQDLRQSRLVVSSRSTAAVWSASRTGPGSVGRCRAAEAGKGEYASPRLSRPAAASVTPPSRITIRLVLLVPQRRPRIPPFRNARGVPRAPPPVGALRGLAASRVIPAIVPPSAVPASTRATPPGGAPRDLTHRLLRRIVRFSP